MLDTNSNLPIGRIFDFVKIWSISRLGYSFISIHFFRRHFYKEQSYQK